MTNKPEVVGFATHHDEPMLFPNRKEAAAYCGDGEEPVALIRLSDYEALQSTHEEELFCVRQDRAAHFGSLMRALEQVDALQDECEELKRALAESQANDRQAMAYLSEVRAIVGGDDFPDMVRRCEKLRAECERLRAAMIEAKSYIDHYMYGGSIYREPAAEAIAIIDAAMEGDKP